MLDLHNVLEYYGVLTPGRIRECLKATGFTTIKCHQYIIPVTDGLDLDDLIAVFMDDLYNQDLV